MSEQQQQQQNQQDQDQRQQQQQQQDQQTEQIVLDPETYQALLDRLDELEGLVNKSGDLEDDDLDDVDSLAREAQRGTQRDEPEINLDEMSRKDFLQFTLQQISEGVVTPLAVAVEELKLSQEIDRLTRRKGYEDFWDYKDEIYRIAKDNPKLSLEKVYKLAKAEAEEKQTNLPAKKGTSRERLLRHLPNLGERPSGQTGSATEKSEPKSLREAAERAFDEVIQGNKE